jgi:hypothetical protein
MEKKRIDPSKINGWGMDADHENEPTYPIKKYTGDDHQRSQWERPTLQQSNVKILKSTERPTLSAVYGTGQPPSGLSGALRKFGYSYSENMNRRWLTLILADRIDIMEENVNDLLHGRIPNVFKERGIGVLAKYKPGLLAWKASVRILAIAGIVAVVWALKKNNN